MFYSNVGRLIFTYETPKENNANSNTLKVSDLLSVAKYTLQVLKL